MTALGLPKVSFARIVKDIDMALTSGKELLMSCWGKLATRIHTMVQKVEQDIPDYKPYTVTVFDTDKVRSELVAKSWDWYAQQWLTLSKLHTAACGLKSPLLGKFEDSHTSINSSADRALSDGRGFVATVSCAKLILEVLPATAKANRAKVLSTHIEKSKGMNLPTNLHEYLVRELAKLTAAAARSPAQASSSTR